MKKKMKDKIPYIVSAFLILAGITGLIISVVMKSNQPVQAASEKEQITFAVYGDTETETIIRQAVQLFADKNNCEITVYCYPTESELNAKILGQIAGGDGFDLFYVNQDAFRILMEKNQLQNLDDVVESRSKEGDAYYASVLENGNLSGAQYGFPVGVMPYMIYYNKTFFEEKGLNTPQEYFDSNTWNMDSFQNCVTTIHEITQSSVFALADTWSNLEPLLKSNGGAFSYVDGKAAMDETALQTAESVGNLIQAGAISYGSNADYKANRRKFVNGELPMIVGDLTMTRVCSDISSFEWDIVPYPSVDSDFSNSSFEVPLIAVGNGKHTALAKKFLDYYVSTLGQKQRLENGECLIPSLNMTFYTSMGDVKFPEHSNYYFFAIENGYSCNGTDVTVKEQDEIIQQWEEIAGGVS